MKIMKANAGNIPVSSNTMRSKSFSRWFGKHTIVVAWVALTLAVLLPPKGVGISLCWMRGNLGIPCPGCGLTRSFSYAVRGRIYESWMFHPFGPFLLAMFLAVAVVSLLPATRHARLTAVMERHSRLSRAVFIVLVVAFCSYGFLRAVLQLAGFCRFNA